MSYIKFETEIVINEITVKHQTIDLVEYLKANRDKSKTYMIQGEIKTISYAEKLSEILNCSPVQDVFNKKPIKKQHELQELIDRLKDRYDGCMPEHGIVYPTPVKVLKNKILVDTYGYGDVANSQHDTNYINRDVKTWNRPQPFPADYNVLDAKLKNIGDKTVILGNKSDPFMWMDMKYQFTKYTLRKIKGCKLEIYTRSDLIAQDEYIELLDKNNTTINIYIPKHRNDELARCEEPGAPSVKRRLQAVEKLKSLGFTVNIINTKVLTRKNKQVS
jgi:hypothetical protein